MFSRQLKYFCSCFLAQEEKTDSSKCQKSRITDPLNSSKFTSTALSSKKLVLQGFDQPLQGSWTYSIPSISEIGDHVDICRLILYWWNFWSLFYIPEADQVSEWVEAEARLGPRVMCLVNLRIETWRGKKWRLKVGRLFGPSLKIPWSLKWKLYTFVYIWANLEGSGGWQYLRLQGQFWCRPGEDERAGRREIEMFTDM